MVYAGVYGFMLDFEELIGGAAVVTAIGYALVSFIASALVVAGELWVLLNFFTLLEWAGTLGIIAVPAKIVIAVVALSGLGIALAVVVIFLLVLSAVVGVLLD